MASGAGMRSAQVGTTMEAGNDCDALWRPRWAQGQGALGEHQVAGRRNPVSRRRNVYPDNPPTIVCGNGLLSASTTKRSSDILRIEAHSAEGGKSRSTVLERSILTTCRTQNPYCSIQASLISSSTVTERKMHLCISPTQGDSHAN
jgi:hypothetical protein